MSPLSKEIFTQPLPRINGRARAKKRGKSDDQNPEECLSPRSSLLPSSPSKYLAVHLLIILSRLLEEQRRTLQQLGGPLRWREGAIRRGIRERPSSNGCTMHSQKSFAPLSSANSFSFFNRTFHISTNRKTGSAAAAAAVERKGDTDKNRVVSSSSSAQFQLPIPSPPTLGLPYLPVSAPLPYADWKPEARARVRQKRYVRIRCRRCERRR